MSRQHSEALFTGRAIAMCPAAARKVGHLPATMVQQLYWLSRRTEDGFVRLTLEQWGDEVGCNPSSASRGFAKLDELGLVDVDESQAQRGYRPNYAQLLALVPELSLTPKAVEAVLQIATPNPPGKRDRAADGPGSIEGRNESSEERPQNRKTAATHVTEQDHSAREAGRNGGSGGESEHDLAQVEAALVDSLRAPERRGDTQ